PAELIYFSSHAYAHLRDLHSFPTRRSSDLGKHFGNTALYLRTQRAFFQRIERADRLNPPPRRFLGDGIETHRGGGFKRSARSMRSEEHTSELQSRSDLVCRLLLEKKKQTTR